MVSDNLNVIIDNLIDILLRNETAVFISETVSYNFLVYSIKESFEDTPLFGLTCLKVEDLEHLDEYKEEISLNDHILIYTGD